MLGFSVSQATVSRYMPARSRRPGQSWRTFLRNQVMAFGHCEYSEEWRSGKARLQSQSYSAQLERSGATQITTVWIGRKRSFGRAQSTLSNRRIRLRSAECDHRVTHRAAYVSSGSRRALGNRRGAAFLFEVHRVSAPRQLSRVSVRADEVLRNHSQLKDPVRWVAEQRDFAPQNPKPPNSSRRPAKSFPLALRLCERARGKVVCVSSARSKPKRPA